MIAARVNPVLMRIAAVGYIAFGLYLILCFVALIVMRRNVRIFPAPPAVESGSRPCSGSRRTACQGEGGLDPIWREFHATAEGNDR